MAVSINGWPVLDNPPWGDPRAKQATIPGVGTTLWVQKDCWPFFAALVREYNDKINKVHSSDGYDYRQSRTSSSWSNHSSGTAVDINADAEGARGTGSAGWWKTAKRNIKAWRIRKKFEIVTWGAWTDYADDPSTPQVEGWDAGWSDPMHWELKSGTSVADVQRVIAKLGIQPDGTITKP